MDGKSLPASSESRIRVAIVEDDESFGASMAKIIGGTPDMTVVAHATTLSQGKQLLPGRPADVILIDLGLPDGSGIELIHSVRQNWQNCEIMVLTLFSDEASAIQSIEAGAGGYLLKDTALQRIPEEIRSLHEGGSPISPRIARHILSKLTTRDPVKPVLPPQNAENLLSSRERQVLDLIVKGRTYDEIGTIIQVSRHTVRTFIRRIYTKFEVCSKIEAINKARELRIVKH